jgi:hypothetical protein
MAEPSKDLAPLSHTLVARNDVLQALQAVLLDLDNQRQALAEKGDYESLAEGGQDLEVITKDLRDILDQTRKDLAKILDEKQGQLSSDGTYYFGINRQEVPGVGVVEVNGGWTRTKWRSEDLLRHLLGKVVEDSTEKIVNEDGEVIPVADSQLLYDIIRVVKDTMPLTASLSWKVGQETKDGKITGLKKHGVTDTDWCERNPKPRLATIPKRSLT